MLAAIQSSRRRRLQVRLVVHAVSMKGVQLHGRVVGDPSAAMYLLMIALAVVDALKLMVLSIATFKHLRLLVLRNTLTATCAPAGLRLGYHVDVLLFAAAWMMVMEMVQVRVLLRSRHLRHD